MCQQIEVPPWCGTWRQNSISWEVKNFGKKKRNLSNINAAIYTVYEHERDKNVPALRDKCSALVEKRHQCIWTKANEYGLEVMALNFHIFSQISGFGTIFSTVENIRKNYHTYRTRLSSVASEPWFWSPLNIFFCDFVYFPVSSKFLSRYPDDW